MKKKQLKSIEERDEIDNILLKIISDEDTMNQKIKEAL